MSAYIIYISTYSTGAYFDYFFRCMCFLLLIDLYPLDTLTLHFLFLVLLQSIMSVLVCNIFG